MVLTVLLTVGVLLGVLSARLAPVALAPLAPARTLAPLAPVAPPPPAPARTLAPLAPTAGAQDAFATEFARLKQGRAYKPAATGALRRRHGQFEYWLVIPKNYDPAKRYQVQFQLHGGVMRPEPALRGTGAVRHESAEQIYIMPAGWNEAPWWTDVQVASFRTILEDVKREYNVDENRVFVSGVSDGGTGAYYVAMRDTTPYAGFVPLNGHVLVLRNEQLNVTGGLFLTNLRNKPLFIVNGGKDPLYPTDAVEPAIVFLHQAGVRITYKPQPQAGHDTSWWPTVRDDFDTFTRTHPRMPLPDKLTWEVSATRSWNRAHWLIIDSLGATAGDATDMDDMNQSANGPIFKNGKSGRVDLNTSGNTINAFSRGVKEFTLLLSPDQFDFDKPIVVKVNGRVAFDGRVERSVATLTKWAARDHDRTMLFGAELKIRP